MQINSILYKQFALQSLAKTIFKAILGASAIGLLAQIVIPLPFTPVPITLQTLGVMSVVMFLGRVSSISLFLYLCIGAIGMPWFANQSGGFSILMGPTAGYLFGFFIYSLFVPYVLALVKKQSFLLLAGILLVLNFLFIFVPGLIGLYFWLGSIQQTSSLAGLLTMGYLPFIPGDILKTFLATSLFCRWQKRHGC